MRKFNFLALAANYSTYPTSQASLLCLTQQEIALKRLHNSSLRHEVKQKIPYYWVENLGTVTRIK